MTGKQKSQFNVFHALQIFYPRQKKKYLHYHIQRSCTPPTWKHFSQAMFMSFWGLGGYRLSRLPHYWLNDSTETNFKSWTFMQRFLWKPPTCWECRRGSAMPRLQGSSGSSPDPHRLSQFCPRSHILLVFQWLLRFRKEAGVGVHRTEPALMPGSFQ